MGGGVAPGHGPLDVDLRKVGPVAEPDPGVRGIVHHRAHEVVGVGFWHPEQLHEPRRRDLVEPRCQPGEDPFLAEPLVFDRHAGKADEPRGVDLDGEAGGGAKAVGDHLGTAGEASLLGIVGGHGPAQPPEPLFDGGERGPVLLERDPQHLRHALGGEIVLGGAHPTAHHDEVGAGGGLADGGKEVLPVVTHERLPPGEEAQLEEPVHEPGGVGIQHLSAQQLVPGGQDLDPHRFHVACS